MPRMRLFLQFTGYEVSRETLQQVEARILRLTTQSALLRWDAYYARTRQCCTSLFDRLRHTAGRSKKTQLPIARLRQLLMGMGGGSLSSLAGDPTLLERIEAHLRESRDLELQQLLKEYLAKV